MLQGYFEITKILYFFNLRILYVFIKINEVVMIN